MKGFRITVPNLNSAIKFEDPVMEALAQAKTACYWKVFIADTKEQMYEAVEAWSESVDRPVPERDYGALTCPYERVDYSKSEEGAVDPCMGHLYFHQECLGAGVVSHELFHAAAQAERRLNNNKYCVLGPEIDEEEERVAYYLTSFCDQFVAFSFEEE